MIYKTTITADTTTQDNVTANVELTIQDNLIQDVIIDRDLDIDAWNFFYFEAVNELDFYPENMGDFVKR